MSETTIVSTAETVSKESVQLLGMSEERMTTTGLRNESHVNSKEQSVNGYEADQPESHDDVREEAVQPSPEDVLSEDKKDRNLSDTTPMTPPTTPVTRESVSDDLSPGTSLLSWFSPNAFLTRVAEKAKNSVDSMITTLDPGMKEYLYSGGDVSIVVASDKDVKVNPVRDAFIDVFGRATVKGVAAQSSSVACQPIGPESAMKAAIERISFIRTNLTYDIPQNQVIVAIESFLNEVTPGSWFEVALFLLEDPFSSYSPIILYSQSTPIPSEAVEFLRKETPEEYQLKETGFSKTIGYYMSSKHEISHESWHESLVGIPRHSLLYMTASALASVYQRKCFSHRIQNV